RQGSGWQRPIGQGLEHAQPDSGQDNAETGGAPDVDDRAGAQVQIEENHLLQRVGGDGHGLVLLGGGRGYWAARVPTGFIHKLTKVGCIVSSTVLSSSCERASRSTRSRRLAPKAARVRAAS